MKDGKLSFTCLCSLMTACFKTLLLASTHALSCALSGCIDCASLTAEETFRRRGRKNIALASNDSKTSQKKRKSKLSIKVLNKNTCQFIFLNQN